MKQVLLVWPSATIYTYNTHKMAINQRRKGNKNERKATNLLEAWTGKKFSRTPGSGGLQWKNSIAKGDVVCITEGHYFPFSIEVKAYEKIDFSELIRPNKKKSLIEVFWEQCIRDAQLCNKKPMLLVRYNGLPADFFFVIIPCQILELFESQEDYLTYPKLGIAITGSDSLLKTNYKTIRKAIKKFPYEY